MSYNRKPRKKYCNLCSKCIVHIDYKDVDLLQRFLNQSNKIAPKRTTGCCAKHQRAVAVAIKRARLVALLPFVKE
ncbi:MAG: 30S ribosomal protein S18 [Mycoplasma sp.]